MDFDNIRPIVSGILGGAVALWLGSLWEGRQSRTARRSNERLLRSHRLAVYLASGCFFAGLLFGVTLYPLAGFAQTDWRPLGLGFGGGCLAALLVLTAMPVLTGGRIRDAFAAFAVSERSPALFIYAILGGGVLAFLLALVSLVG